MQFDTNKYKVYTLKNWMVLHWILNPGLAFNELILGQRIPKVYLEDKQSEKQAFERSIVPCPHCGAMHDGRVWSGQNGTAFKNWFGLYCPKCGNIIPCISNLTSLLILGITSPFWLPFRKSFKEKWLKAQPKRYENISVEKVENTFDKKGWVKTGLEFGLFMFVFMTLFDVIEDTFIWGKFLISIPIWILAGLAFGYFMKLFMTRVVKQKG